MLITIERNTPFRRTTEYQSYNNSFRPSAVNKDFDLIWWKLQELGYRDQVIWLALVKEIADRISGDVNLQNQINTIDDWLENLQQNVNENTSDIAQLVNDLSKEIADRIKGDQILKDMFLSMIDEAINDGTINALAITHLDSLEALEGVTNVWDGRTVYVKDKGNYRYDALTGSWVKAYQDTTNIIDGVETQKQINDKTIRVFESVFELMGYTPRLNGQTVYVKSYHAGWAAKAFYRGPIGGGNFIYDSSKASINDGGLVINGWVRQFDGSTVYPEWWGAKPNSSYDNSGNFEAMFNALNPMPITNATFNELVEKTTAVSYKVILSGLYRYTRSLHIPPGFTIEQATDGYFMRECKIGLFYDPENLQSYAISSFFYKKNSNGRYDLDTNLYTLPTGVEIDNGTYVQTGQHIHLEKMTIITKPGVYLGLRWLGCSGSTTNLLSIGENTNGASNVARCPRVAMLTCGSWGSFHQTPRLLYTSQGVVAVNSNGGTVMDTPYICRRGVDTNYIETPIYPIPDFNETGSIAVTQIKSELTLRNPILEACSFAQLAYQSTIDTYLPHIESFDGYLKNCFYLIDSDAYVHLKRAYVTDLTYANNSIFYLKNCSPIYRNVVISGSMGKLGYPLVKGDNSGAIVDLEFGKAYNYFQYGKVGNWDLIRSVKNKNQNFYSVIVNETSGSDENFGLHVDRPLKTLKYAKKICDLFGVKRVDLKSDINPTSNIELPDAVISGNYNINFPKGYMFELNGPYLNCVISCTSLNKNEINPLFRTSGYTTGFIQLNTKLNAGGNTGDANLFLINSNANLDIHINSPEIICSKYAWCNSYVISLGLHVICPNRPTSIDSNPIGGTALLKFSRFANNI